MKTLALYQRTLKDELARRCERNPRYSVRAFAKALKLDAGALSRILSGKQIPSYKVAQQILETLPLDHEQRRLFFVSVAETQRARGLDRMSPVFAVLEQAGERGTDTVGAQKEFSIDYYRVIADWYHVAILELTFVEGFSSDARYIARALGITQTEAKLAVERLLELGLLEKRGGKLVKTDTQLTTADKHLTTPALRKNQKQWLEKAIDSLENDPIDERSMTSMTMAIDPKKLPEARELIRRFNRELCALLETGRRTRVYNLGISLYPLQKNKENEK